MLKAENRTGYAYDKIHLQIDVLQMLYSEINFIQGDSILNFDQSLLLLDKMQLYSLRLGAILETCII